VDCEDEYNDGMAYVNGNKTESLVFGSGFEWIAFQKSG
jgi:hypothetical protein